MDITINTVTTRAMKDDIAIAATVEPV